MLESLKKEVYEANMELVARGLVINTWGNVSGIDRASGLVVIKPSGVPYDELTPDCLPVLDLDGRVIEGKLKPSSDTPTHLALYRAFPEIGGVTHTHSTHAVAFAQAGRSIAAYGTTHADYFSGAIPCTRKMTPEEIAVSYEKETATVIIEAIKPIGAERMRAALVHSHGPFTWGKNAPESVEVSAVLEVVAQMALYTEQLFAAAGQKPEIIQPELLSRHYDRKHGKNAYYGQN